MRVADFLIADCRAQLAARHVGAHEAPTSVRRWVDGVRLSLVIPIPGLKPRQQFN